MNTSYGMAPAGWAKQSTEVEARKKAGYVFMPAKKLAGLSGRQPSGEWVQLVQVPVAGTPSVVQLHDEPPLSPEEEEELAACAVTIGVQRELF